MGAQIINQRDLPASNISRDLVGADHEGVGVSLIFVDAPQGSGPKLHKHAYEEIFIVLEGEVTLVAGNSEVRAGAGDVVIISPDTPHAFTNTGSGTLRQIDIHVNPTFETEWL